MNGGDPLRLLIPWLLWAPVNMPKGMALYFFRLAAGPGQVRLRPTAYTLSFFVAFALTFWLLVRRRPNRSLDRS
jgi:hypothetical protein